MQIPNTLAFNPRALDNRWLSKVQLVQQFIFCTIIGPNCWNMLLLKYCNRRQCKWKYQWRVNLWNFMPLRSANIRFVLQVSNWLISVYKRIYYALQRSLTVSRGRQKQDAKRRTSNISLVTAAAAAAAAEYVTISVTWSRNDTIVPVHFLAPHYATAPHSTSTHPNRVPRLAGTEITGFGERGTFIPLRTASEITMGDIYPPVSDPNTDLSLNNNRRRTPIPQP